MASAAQKRRAGITPSNEQARAIRAIKDWYKNSKQQEFLLDGEAGTGKSTTAGFAVAELKLSKVVSGAFTAKAAKVMRDKGVEGASTIHKMIYIPVKQKDGKVRWRLDKQSICASADLVVIDEVSMVNHEIADHLRSYGKKILVLGDVDGQLPPVEGTGAFTNREPDFRLLELNRFALESPIVRLAARARRRQWIPFGTTGDVEVLPLNDETMERVHRPDTQVICGTHRSRYSFTQAIRQRLEYDSVWPEAGERLICCRNNYELGLFNGGFGIADADATEEDDALLLDVTMEDLDKPLTELDVMTPLFRQHFDSKVKRPPMIPRGMSEFDWGYAVTCHKAQGSEWPHVTVIDDSGAFYYMGGEDLSRRWLYTALTRASHGLTLLRRERKST